MSEVEQTVIKRGPGRPRVEQSPEVQTTSKPMQAVEAPIKKGNPSWRPANTVDVLNKEAGFRYRMIRKDDRNIAKKQAEGWEILSGINAQGTTAETGYGRINEGKKISSVLEGNDFVIGRIPEEKAKLRDAYYNNESDRRTKALYRKAKEDSKGEIHGNITIERKGVRTVIED